MEWSRGGVERELTLGRVVADRTGDDAEHDGTKRRDETGCRRGRHQARDGTGTPSHHRPLPRQPPVQQSPRGRSQHGRQVSIPARHDGAEIGAKGRTAVEAQPSEPEQGGAEDDHGDVMGPEVDHQAFLPAAEHQGVGQGGHAGADFDGAAAGVVHHAVFVGPAVDVPGPAGDRAVDQRGPEEDEDHHRGETAAFGDGADDDGGRGRAELHLPGQWVCREPNQRPRRTW